MARSCGLDALAAPPAYPRASGGGRAAVASSPAFCAGGRGYGLLRGGLVVCAAGGFCARSRPVRPALRAGGWRAPPGVPQPRAPQTPASGQLRPPSGCCALPMGFSALAAGATALYRCFQRPKRVFHSPQLLFPACQGLIVALRPCSSPVERAHPDPPRSCARASGHHVRLLGFLSLLGASPTLVVRPWFSRLVPLLVVPRSNRLLSLSLWFFPSLRWPTPPPTRPPCRVHVGGAWRACRRRLLLLSLLSRSVRLVRWPLLFFGRRGSPAGRPRAFDRHRLALLPLPFSVPPGSSAGKGGTRPAAPPASAPDDTACILHTGLPATDRRPRRRLNPYPAHRRRGVVSPAPVHKILCTKSPRAVKTAQGQS